VGASPAKKAVARIQEKVGDLLVPRHVGTWPEVRDRLNRRLRGWSAYYSYGTRMPAYRAIDNQVYPSVRNFLRRRHQVQSRGTGRNGVPPPHRETRAFEFSPATSHNKSLGGLRCVTCLGFLPE